LAATWCWPTLAQMNHSELSHMAGAVDDSTINIVVVIIIGYYLDLMFSVLYQIQSYYFMNGIWQLLKTKENYKIEISDACLFQCHANVPQWYRWFIYIHVSFAVCRIRMTTIVTRKDEIGQRHSTFSTSVLFIEVYRKTYQSDSGDNRTMWTLGSPHASGVTKNKLTRKWNRVQRLHGIPSTV